MKDLAIFIFALDQPESVSPRNYVRNLVRRESLDWVRVLGIILIVLGTLIINLFPGIPHTNERRFSIYCASELAVSIAQVRLRARDIPRCCQRYPVVS
jgi:hypothetical protein